MDEKSAEAKSTLACVSCGYNVLWTLKYSCEQWYCALCYAIHLEKPRAANRKKMPKSKVIDEKREILQHLRCAECKLSAAPFCEYSRISTMPPNFFTHCFVLRLDSAASTVNTATASNSATAVVNTPLSAINGTDSSTCRCMNCFIVRTRTQDKCKRQLLQLKKLVPSFAKLSLSDALALSRHVPATRNHQKQLHFLARRFPKRDMANGKEKSQGKNGGATNNYTNSESSDNKEEDRELLWIRTYDT